MAWNLPSYDTDSFSFGPGVLYIRPTGATPSIDIGGVRPGAELTVSREKLDVFQGTPQQLVKQYVTSETFEFTINGIEWNVLNLIYALAGGATHTTTLAGTTHHYIGFGGDINLTEVALKFEHRLPVGSTIEIDIWRAQGTGDVTLTFAEDLHEIPYGFTALQTSTDWNGNALPAIEQYIRIAKIPYPGTTP